MVCSLWARTLVFLSLVLSSKLLIRGFTRPTSRGGVWGSFHTHHSTRSATSLMSLDWFWRHCGGREPEKSRHTENADIHPVPDLPVPKTRDFDSTKTSLRECDHPLSPLYLDKLCDDALVYAEPLSPEVMPHQVSHRSDPTGGNGNLEQHGCCYQLATWKSRVSVDCMAFKFSIGKTFVLTTVVRTSW